MPYRTRSRTVTSDDSSTLVTFIDNDPVSSTSAIVTEPRSSRKQKPIRMLQGLFITINASVSLEATLVIPDPNNIPFANKLAILSHPWSWLGGTMNDPVLRDLAKTFLKQDYHVLLFNSRGVGLSSGRSSFTGIPEAQDLNGVVDWALKEVANVQTLVMLGYSYGSLIQTLYPGPQSIHPNIFKVSYILLSHALGPVSLLTMFNSKTYTKALDELLLQSKTDVLCIYGDRDQFTSTKRYLAWTEHLKAVIKQRKVPKIQPAVADRRGAFQATQIEGADHFWRGNRGREMRKVVTDWITKLENGTLQG